MKFNLKNVKDIKDCSNEDLREICNGLSPEEIQQMKTVLKEYLQKQKTRLTFFEEKLTKEKEMTQFLLNRVWNAMDKKNKKMAEVFKEIEHKINKNNLL